MTTVRITDAGGNKPKFVQWDVDRVLYVSGVASQPCLHFANAELKRAIVVQATDDNGRWKCLVPNFILQFACPMVVSVFVQPDEGRTVATAVYEVKPKLKPQDYSYTENIGYINWVQKSEEVQQILESSQDTLDEINETLAQIQHDYDTDAFKGDKGDKGDPFTYEDFTAEQLAALTGPQGPKGDKGDTGTAGTNGTNGSDGYSPTVTVTSITGGHRITIIDKNGTQSFDVMDGEGGGSITIDDALSDASTNPVQNRIIKAALDAKGTYSKPSGGIPASDLASGVIPSVPAASSTTPLMDGNGSAGSAATYARADHVHPTDTSRAAAADLAAKADKVTEVTVSTAGAVTQALDAGKIYHFTGALTALTITLNTPASGQLAHYHFDFDSGSTAPTLTLPNTVTMPSGFTVEASKHYEIDILNNYGAVMAWANS